MIYVIGDAILDEFWYGTTTRLSPEAPVPIIENIQKTRTGGGAVNVVANLRSLGSTPKLFSACGLDSAGYSLRTMEPNADWRNTEETIHKTRIYTNGQCIGRIDIDPPQPIVGWPNTFSDDYIILSDYNKGTIGNATLDIQKSPAKVLVDPKKPLHNYTGAWVVKPNWKEYHQFVGDGSNLVSEARAALKANSISIMLVTAGPAGIFVITMNDFFHVPAKPVDVVDITGAGDTVIASFTHHYSIHHDLKAATEFAVLMASQVISQHGASVAKLPKEKIVFTNGCFDILHPGHIRLLQYAKSLGTKLIVGLNSDKSIKALKGENRPIVNQETRKATLEALGIVDEVNVFYEDTPYNLINLIKPDIIVKGGDYIADDVVGADIAQVVIYPTQPGFSTTSIIEGLNK